MTAAALPAVHPTAIERLPRRRYRGWCSCGWVGRVRRWAISAADDNAAHLLEVQS